MVFNRDLLAPIFLSSPSRASSGLILAWLTGVSFLSSQFISIIKYIMLIVCREVKVSNKKIMLIIGL